MEKASKSAKMDQVLKTKALNEATKELQTDKGLTEEGGEVEDQSTEGDKIDKEIQDGVDEEKDILTSTMDVMNNNKKSKPIGLQSLAALPQKSGEISADFFDSY